LSAPQRAAFDLVKTEGLSHAQAAAVLGTSVTGIKLRLHRVYLVLRGALEAGEKPPLVPPVRTFNGFETRDRFVAAAPFPTPCR
jgi:hypothetical protein